MRPHQNPTYTMCVYHKCTSQIVQWCIGLKLCRWGKQNFATLERHEELNVDINANNDKLNWYKKGEKEELRFSPSCQLPGHSQNGGSLGSAPWPWKGCLGQCRWWWPGQQTGPWQSSRPHVWVSAKRESTPRWGRCWQTCTNREGISSEIPPTLKQEMKKRGNRQEGEEKQNS